MDTSNFYNKIIDYTECNYDFLQDNEKKSFVIGYILALKDNKILNNEEIISLISEILLIKFY